MIKIIIEIFIKKKNKINSIFKTIKKNFALMYIIYKFN